MLLRSVSTSDPTLSRFTRMPRVRLVVDIVRLVREVAEDRRGNISDAGLSLFLELPQGPLWVDGEIGRAHV